MTGSAELSVVVPTRDGPAQLAACLGALARIEAPPGGFEMILANDGTRPCSSVLAEGKGLDLKVIETGGRGPAAARNAGAAEAHGGLIAFTDDDCALPPRWAIALVRAIASNRVR